jgi:hypothetical protein
MVSTIFCVTFFAGVEQHITYGPRYLLTFADAGSYKFDQEAALKRR